jgi:molybdate-binding protein
MKSYQYIVIRDTQSDASAEYSTKKECFAAALRTAKKECEEMAVHGVHDHRIIITKDDSDIAQIELPTHDDYYNHSDAKPYEENEALVKLYQKNLTIK